MPLRTLSGRLLARLMQVCSILSVCLLSTHYAKAAASQPGVCYVGYMQYVYDAFEQRCYHHDWTHTNTEQSYDTVYDSSNSVAARHNAQPSFISTTTDDLVAQHTATSSTEYLTVEDNGPAGFMSFEDWKEKKAREAIQEAVDGRQDQDKAGNQQSTEALDDGGDIALKVEAVTEEISSIAAPPSRASAETLDGELKQDSILYDDGKTQYYRSKDAGKTCKERFSYSSFDAGATVLKSNDGAKNAKAILVENKDSYMLLECAAANKFVIVELTEDILVDTVVIANFEFFSSMIRHFRVSVSDRYPVKIDKWKVLGDFEARNSRDIQAFLIDNPLVWAKYVRIEFLSHYGNEYYCPVSLLRVHGTRMLESWKETEANIEDEEHELESDMESQGANTNPGEDASTGRLYPSGYKVSVPDLPHVAMDGVSENLMLPGLVFSKTREESYTCPTDRDGVSNFVAAADESMVPMSSHALGREKNESQPPSDNQDRAIYEHDQQSIENRGSTHRTASDTPSTQAESAASSSPVSTLNPEPQSTSLSADHDRSPGAALVGKATHIPQSVSRSRDITSASSTASPIVQESFHKTVSKRLQLLEANVSLSMQYLEDQSRALRETQRSAEQRQLAKVDQFLDSLNHTVLSELRNVRQQYDQVWQSTVSALESQRAQSQRETIALSSRLNILADEVVFQKRMAIVQAILLLSCLVLVIFSRSATPNLPLTMPHDMTSSLWPKYTLSATFGRFSEQQPETFSSQEHDTQATSCNGSQTRRSLDGRLPRESSCTTGWDNARYGYSSHEFTDIGQPVEVSSTTSGTQGVRVNHEHAWDHGDDEGSGLYADRNPDRLSSPFIPSPSRSIQERPSTPRQAGLETQTSAPAPSPITATHFQGARKPLPALPESTSDSP